MIPKNIQNYRDSVDLYINLNNDGIKIPSVNEITATTAQVEPIDQNGKVLQRIIQSMELAPGNT